MKQAPKLIGEVFGIDSGSMKLGIADKLGDMAFFGGAAKKGVNTVKGATTGAVGGLSTGLFNKDVSTIEAMKAGAARGSKAGGIQFGAQRKKVFENRYGYNSEQGLFGGKSMRQKAVEKYGKADEQSWKERTNANVESRLMDDDVVNARRTAFTDQAIWNRRTNMNIAKDEAFNQAISKANEYRSAQTSLGREMSQEEFDEVFANYLKDISNTTTDVNKKRKINTYLTDNRILKVNTEYDELLAKRRNARTQADIDSLNKAIDAKKQEIAQIDSEATKYLLDGTISRKGNGDLDDIYTKGFGSDNSFVQNGPKTQPDYEKFADLFKKNTK